MFSILELGKNVEKQNLATKYVTIFLVVGGYWVVSIATVFMNKILLSHMELEAPMFIVWTQTFITAVICYLKKRISIVYPEYFNFPDVGVWDKSTVNAVGPLSALFTTMILTNSLCLKYTSVAYYYIGRSLTTIFNVVFTYIILGELTSKKSIACCLIIVIGFWLGIDQESITGHLSFAGFVFGILGSLSLSLFSIYTKKALPKLQGDIWALSYANNVYASVLLPPLIILSGEWEVLVAYKRFDIYICLLIVIGGLCGFLIGFFTTLQIKYTSPLTHNISGTAKACAQTVLATQIFNETKSVLWWVSNMIVLIGSCLYTWVKQIDMETRHHEAINYQKV